MKSTLGLSAGALAVLLGAICGSAQAQPAGQDQALKYDQPGSLLIFPLVQGDARRDTFLTVTNTNEDCTSCGNRFRFGDVVIQINWIDPSNCSETNASFALSPGDTLTLSVAQQNLGFPEGWAWLDARDPESNAAIQFDYLVGSALLFDGRSAQTWEYNPYPFQAFPGRSHDLGNAKGCWPGIAGFDNCGRALTDVDGEGDADFDGCEYAFWPDEIFLDTFFEESNGFDNELALITPDPFGSTDSHRIDFGFWNNNEVRFSRSDSIFCFFHGRLSDISRIVLGLGGAPNETTDVSGNTYQTGWMELNSAYPVLGVFVQKKTGTRFAGGHELQFRGLQGDEPGEFAASLQRNG
jgi:hypothetical protein